MASNTDQAGNLAVYPPPLPIVLVSGLFLVGGAGVIGVAAATAMISCR